MPDVNSVGGFDFSRLNELFNTLATGAAETPSAKEISNMMVVELKPDADTHRVGIKDIVVELKLPVLSMPTGSLSLDTLMSAIGDEVRRQSCKSGVESLETKAAQQKEINEKELQEIADRLEEMRKKAALSGFMKIFQVIGMIVGAIASAASIAAGAITGNPLLIAAGVIGIGMTIDSVMSVASDGKYSIAAGFTELGKACGLSDEAAEWFGFGMNMAVMFVSIGVSFGAGFGSAASKAAELSSEAIKKAADITIMAARITNVASGVLTTATGAGTIAGAVLDYHIAQSQIDSKLLEAVLERLRESIEMERALVKAELERASELMGKVREIVGECLETQMAVQTGAPSMA